MKKLLTLLTFAFLSSTMLFGQCPDLATPNPNGRFFNLSYFSEADRDAALVGLLNITFPTADGTFTSISLLTDGPIGADGVYRIRADENSTRPFDGSQNGIFTGDIIFNYASGPVVCSYVNTMLVEALPVELVSFVGTKKDRQINLSWKTASEINNDGFLVERGFKTAFGIEWNRLDFINGNGSTQLSQSYSFIDQRPEEGTNYYRLKQMDFDGQYEYSSIIAVEYSSLDGEIGIFPNPVKDRLTLISGEGKATILNVLGQPVKQLTVNASQTTIQLGDLLNGQYYLQVVQENGTMVTKPFSKKN